MKKILLILGVCVWSCLQAEVFWLSPLRGSGSGGAIPLAGALPGVDEAKPLLTEPVLVNGKRFTLEIFASKASFEEITAFLRKKGVHFSLSKETLRCTVIRGKDQLERLLVIRSPGRGPVTVMRMAGKAGVPAVSGWPPHLPELPSGTRPLQVIELPKRKGIYGVFDGGSTDPVHAFRHIDSGLRARGWLPAGNEGSPLIGGSGDIYYNRKTRQIMWVTCDASGRGAFYCRQQ